MRRRVLVGVGSAALVAGAAVGWWRHAGLGQDATAGALDSSFWDLRLRSAAGGEVALSAYKGQRLVLNFWATWCPPCIRELPALDRFQREFGPPAVPGGWQVLGLAIDGIGPVLTFSQQVKVGFPLLVAEAQGLGLSQRLGNAGGLPFTALIDTEGRLLRSKAGETHFEELATWAKEA